MKTVNPSQILGALSPMAPNPIIGFAIYFMFFMILVAIFLQKRSNNTITVLLFGTILCLLVDKLGVLPNSSFGLYIVRIYIFVVPIIVAGMTKWEKSRAPLALCALVGFFYMFLRWFFEMRGV
jgi:hypothetical protein